MIINKPYKIGNIEVKNRLVRSATYEAMATDEGYATPQHLNLYKNLAEGGIGLIITGFAYVHPNGQAAHEQLAIYDDKFILTLLIANKELYTRIVRSVIAELCLR